MPLRNQQTLDITDILLRDKTDGNPLATGPEGGRLENFYIDQGKLVRSTFTPPFHTSAAVAKVWCSKEFNFTRDNAPEQQLLIFKDNGKVYRRRGGEEIQTYPEDDVPSAGVAGDSAYAGTGSTTAGAGTDWSNATNVTGAANSTYATSANTGTGLSQGDNLPDVGAEEAGGEPWSSISNITAEDSTGATNTVGEQATTNWLDATDYDFAIPTDAIIAGIVVSVRYKATGGVAAHDCSQAVQLIKAGARAGQGSGKLESGGQDTSYTTLIFGSLSDLWGTTWTPAQINATNFGAGFRGTNNENEGQGSVTFNIDTIKITVYYSLLNTDLLNATNYGMTPTGNIAGITVKVTGKITIIGGSTDSTMTVQLYNATGALAGGSISQDFTSTSDVTLTFGGSGTLWGASWIAADFADTDFGAAVYCTKATSPSGLVTFSIDSVQILVEVSGSDDTTTALFTRKPSMAQIANRLLVSDGRIIRIYDGWNWFVAGLAAPTDFDSSDTSLTSTGLTGTYDVAITAVHIRNNNGIDDRVHESNRSALATESPSNQGIQVAITAVTFPARATHWSVYMEDSAGSGVLRRVTTLPITTTTYTITAEPASTSPTAPERNDPIQPSRVLCQWKNRIAVRSETNPDQFWFTAFGEVDGLLNGSGEECLPGRLGSDSLSDLVNEWQIPDGGQPMQCAIYHGEHLWVFTDRTGFIIQGEGNLLDDQVTRDFIPQRVISFGASGPSAACSTPFGLAVMSHEHKLWFRRNDGVTFDIGHDIQSDLDALSEQQLNDIEMAYWSGEGWDWLVLPTPEGLRVFDFGVTSDKSPVGIWFTITCDSIPTAISIFHPNKKFLLSGHEDGSVHQQAQLCQPSHLGLSCTLGETYFGSTVQDSPTAVARTGPISEKEWSVMKYLQYYHRGHTDQTAITTTDPTINAYYDPTNPAAPDTAITLTSATVSGSNERRAWFAPSSTASATGTLAKNTHVEVKWTTTDVDTTTDPSARELLVNNELLRLTIARQPKGLLTR